MNLSERVPPIGITNYRMFLKHAVFFIKKPTIKFLKLDPFSKWFHYLLETAFQNQIDKSNDSFPLIKPYFIQHYHSLLYFDSNLEAK